MFALALPYLIKWGIPFIIGGMLAGGGGMAVRAARPCHPDHLHHQPTGQTPTRGDGFVRARQGADRRGGYDGSDRLGIIVRIQPDRPYLFGCQGGVEFDR